MEVYYHKTSGGAEYLSTTYIECPNGHREGTLEGVFARIDCGEFTLYPKRLKEHGFDCISIKDVKILCE